jgi:diacylglycerol kinase family enzyme
VAVEADRPLPIEADGALLGTTPATFQIVPRALRLKL